MLAFILAIGMSFAFVKTSAEKDYSTEKYILVEEPNGWATITVDCDPQDDECLVTFSSNPTKVYKVYDAKDLEMPSEGSGQVILLNRQVPDPDL